MADQKHLEQSSEGDYYIEGIFKHLNKHGYRQADIDTCFMYK